MEVSLRGTEVRSSSYKSAGVRVRKQSVGGKLPTTDTFSPRRRGRVCCREFSPRQQTRSLRRQHSHLPSQVLATDRRPSNNYKTAMVMRLRALNEFLEVAAPDLDFRQSQLTKLPGLRKVFNPDMGEAGRENAAELAEAGGIERVRLDSVWRVVRQDFVGN